MRCPICQSKTRVAETRGLVRRRVCLNKTCRQRFLTQETFKALAQALPAKCAAPVTANRAPRANPRFEQRERPRAQPVTDVEDDMMDADVAGVIGDMGIRIGGQYE